MTPAAGSSRSSEAEVAGATATTFDGGSSYISSPDTVDVVWQAPDGAGAADADAKMLRHFKECSRHDRCFVFLSQQFEQRCGVAVDKTRENDCARRGPEALQIAP